MEFHLHSATNSIQLYPEYSYRDEAEKIETVHRSRSGKEYRYKFGDFGRWRIPLSFLTSSDAAQINEWWNTNTDLTYTEDGGTTTYGVRLVNDKKPIGGFVEPYDDLWTGTLELEEYS